MMTIADNADDISSKATVTQQQSSQCAKYE
jgi:hypothetical protein